MRVQSRQAAGGRRTEPATRPVKSDAGLGDPATATLRRPGHVLIVVENLPMGIDHRVRKQVTDLLANGYRLSVVTRRDPANAGYREMTGINVLEYPSPAEPRGKAGYFGEYGMSLFYATVLSLAARSRDQIDVVQFCQPPDIYFALGWILRGLGM
jgi:hypothetical protein